MKQTFLQQQNDFRTRTWYIDKIGPIPIILGLPCISSFPRFVSFRTFVTLSQYSNLCMCVPSNRKDYKNGARTFVCQHILQLLTEVYLELNSRRRVSSTIFDSLRGIAFFSFSHKTKYVDIHIIMRNSRTSKFF